MRAYDLYVALGDSMSSDDYPGPGLGAASLLHRNRDDVHPEFAGRDLVSLNPSTRLANLTLDGATTREVQAVLETLPREEGPTLVTLTVGGNDLIHAVNLGDSIGHAVARLHESLTRILARVAWAFPDRVLRLGTIYDPTDGTGQVQSGHRRFEHDLPHLVQVNGMLAGLVREFGGEAVDLHGHFLGHGMRYDDPAYERFHPEDPTCWIMRDIEPNVRGGSEIRRKFWDSLP